MSGHMNGKLAFEYDWLTNTQSESNYYYPYSLFYKQSPFYDSGSGGDETSRHSYQRQSSPTSHTQSQEPNAIGTRGGMQEQPPFLKRILVVDNEPDILLTFKSSLEQHLDNKGRKMFEVHVYDNPLKALSEFRANFYDLLLTDVYMPDMNGFQLSQKILELDINIRICYVSATDVNISALRELYPALSLGCFITKPVEVEYLVKRLSAELD